jgi:hypothetical protein
MNADISKSSAISAINNGIYGAAEPCKAYVLSNGGDPGRDSDYYCDIRSRFLIAIKDPLKRPLVPAGSDGGKIYLQDNIILVERPKQLWINCPSGLNKNVTNVSQLIRTDANQNINVGSYTNFTQSDISPINRPYQIGEQITVMKLRNYVTADDAAFQSYFSMQPNSILNNTLYIIGNTGNIGQSLPNVIGPNGQIAGGGKDSTKFVQGNNYFFFYLPKVDYETFIQGYFIGKNYQPGAKIPPNMEYYFGNRSRIVFGCASYIDMNSDNKSRDGNATCLPNIVTTSDSFFTPNQRQFNYLYYTKI